MTSSLVHLRKTDMSRQNSSVHGHRRPSIIYIIKELNITVKTKNRKLLAACCGSAESSGTDARRDEVSPLLQHFALMTL